MNAFLSIDSQCFLFSFYKIAEDQFNKMKRFTGEDIVELIDEMDKIEEYSEIVYSLLELKNTDWLMSECKLFNEEDEEFLYLPVDKCSATRKLEKGFYYVGVDIVENYGFEISDLEKLQIGKIKTSKIKQIGSSLFNNLRLRSQDYFPENEIYDLIETDLCLLAKVDKKGKISENYTLILNNFFSADFRSSLLKFE